MAIFGLALGALIMKQIKLIGTLATLLTLTACGGGGSDSPASSTPVAKTCANGAADYPTCTPPVIPASLQQALPSVYAQGSYQLEVFTELNKLRSDVGIGPLNQNPKIDLAAANHQKYITSSWVVGDEGS